MEVKEAWEIIREFKEETPAWLHELKRLHNDAFPSCYVCGAKYESMKKVVEALEVIDPSF